MFVVAVVRRSLELCSSAAKAPTSEEGGLKRRQRRERERRVVVRRRFQHGMTASSADHTNTRSKGASSRVKSKNLPFHKRY